MQQLIQLIYCVQCPQHMQWRVHQFNNLHWFHYINIHTCMNTVWQLTSSNILPGCLLKEKKCPGKLTSTALELAAPIQMVHVTAVEFQWLKWSELLLLTCVQLLLQYLQTKRFLYNKVLSESSSVVLVSTYCQSGILTLVSKSESTASGMTRQQRSNISLAGNNNTLTHYEHSCGLIKYLYIIQYS